MMKTFCFALGLAVAMNAGPQSRATSEAGSAAEVIRAAIVERLGGDADVSVLSVDVPDGAVRFRDARPDPNAWLGKPVRFTLVTDAGTAVAAVATMRVVITHTVTLKAVGRGHLIAPDDVEAVRRELLNTPIRPLPTVDQITGARALRPIPAGATVLSGFVAARRVIEPGDRVTVVAGSGDVEVSAEFVAADGGRVGDTIRVVNPETRKFLRGRIVRKGLVEVNYGR